MDDEKREQIIEALELLWLAKGKEPSGKVLSAYAQILDRYPIKAIRAACATIAADASEFPPVVGAIIAEMARWLRTQRLPDGRSRIPSPDEAWHRAKLTISRYHPQTRPEPRDGDPAIDATLAEIGGIAACQWHDHVGEGIVRRKFLDEYERQIATPAYVAHALSPAVRAARVLSGIELPQHAIEAHGAVEARTQRILDGHQPPTVHQLPAPSGTPLTDDERAELHAEMRRNLEKLLEAWSMDTPKATTVPPLNEDDVPNAPPMPLVDVTGLVSETRAVRHEQEQIRRELERVRKERYG